MRYLPIKVFIMGFQLVKSIVNEEIVLRLSIMLFSAHLPYYYIPKSAYEVTDGKNYHD